MMIIKTNAIGVLQFIAFLDLFGIGMVIPLIANHASKLGASHIHIGLLGSMYAALQLFSQPLVGSLSDLKGRNTILIITLLLCSVLYVLTGLCTSVTLLICLRALTGIFKQTQLLTRALVAEYEKNEGKQADIYGKMAAISGIGITLAPIVGGHVVEGHPEYGFRYLTMAVGACFFINAVISYTCLPEKDPPWTCEDNQQRKDLKYKCDCGSKCKCGHSKPNRNAQSIVPKNIVNIILSSVKDSVVDLYSINWNCYWDCFLLKAFIAFSMSIYFSNYSLYLSTVYNLSPKYIGYVISFQGTITSIASYLMGTINSFYPQDHDFTLRNLHVFIMSCSSLLGLILSYNSLYWYLAWLAPLGFSNGMGRLITLQVILNRSKGEHRGSLIGASNSMRSIAGITAPMVTGLINQYIGIHYSIYASLLSAVLGLSLSYYTWKQGYKSVAKKSL